MLRSFIFALLASTSVRATCSRTQNPLYFAKTSFDCKATTFTIIQTQALGLLGGICAGATSNAFISKLDTNEGLITSTATIEGPSTHLDCYPLDSISNFGCSTYLSSYPAFFELDLQTSDNVESLIY